jgi:DNA-binding response OmpR family regulator
MVSISNKTVSIVDDEALIRKCLQVGLETLRGWKVLQADTGITGFVAAKEEQPDVILLDVSMPEMDGVTALRELQHDEATRHIPVIMMTALSTENDRRRYGELGATWLIPKPFDVIKLPSEVATVLGWDS